MTVVMLNLTGGYFDKLGMMNIYRDWLTTKGIEFSVVDGEVYSHLATAIILNNDIDATAFKLKFGL